MLPTHHLFLLAERGPTTIPDALSLFGGSGGINGSVPPLLKRRIGELVAVIKGAMDATRTRSSPQESAEARREGSEMVALAAVKETGVMSSPMLSLPPTPKLTNESRLWTVTPLSTPAATFTVSRSSLFGVGVSRVHIQEEGMALPSSVGERRTYSATGSVLFGSALLKVGFVA